MNIFKYTLINILFFILSLNYASLPTPIQEDGSSLKFINNIYSSNEKEG